jgi:uncharacterized HAD superfamily protein
MGKRKRGPDGLTFITWSQLHKDIADFAAKMPKDIVGIIGVPRSGLMVASMLAILKNIYVTDVAGFISHGFPNGGLQMKQKQAPVNGKVILLDDSCCSGKSMRAAVGAFGIMQFQPQLQWGNWEVIPATLYTNEKAPPLHHLKVINGMRIFAWNWQTHKHTAKWTAIDMDGILCDDPPREDDEPNYVKSLATLPQRYNVRHAHAIVTNRLEKRRPHTEAWLDAHGVGFTHLIMRPEPTFQQRRLGISPGAWKAEQLRKLGCNLFVESDPVQAKTIAALAGKPVYCPIKDHVYA